MIIIEYSTMGLKPDTYLEKIKAAQEYLKGTDYTLGIQIHNSIDARLLELIMPLCKDFPISVHSPVLSPYFLNLAMTDGEFIQRIARQAVDFLARVPTSLFFFHGFFLVNEPLPHNMREYRRNMIAHISPHLSLEGSFIMHPAYRETEEYQQGKENFIHNFSLLKQSYPELIIALENDFVGIGSAMQHPEVILELLTDFWFDLGHFWCSAILHKFDFYEWGRILIERMKIHGAHINHNLMAPDENPTRLFDSHTHLYTPSRQNLAPLTRYMRERGVERFTLEIVDLDIEDLKILRGWLD